MNNRNHFMRGSFSISMVSIALVMLVGCSTAMSTGGAREPFKFVQMCDPQFGMGGYDKDVARFKKAVEQINALSPDFVVICGDLVGRPQKHTFKDFIECKAAFTIPCHCAAGNHDVGNTPTAESLAYYRKEIGRDYYSFKHKGYTFIIVNTQLWKVDLDGESEKHDVWFKRALAEAHKGGLPVFVIGHYPLFTKSADEKENYYNLPLAKRKELLALFKRFGVVAVLTGHAHKIIINDYNGIQLVTGETTSRSKPLGYRLWHIEGTGPFVHESVPLETDRK